MSLKNKIQPNHIPLNKFDLIVVGGPVLTPVSISGIEEELEVVDLPDRTVASGGNTKAIEFDMGLPMHHIVEQAFMESWFVDAQNQLPGHRKSGSLIHKAVSPIALGRTYTLIDLMPSKRALPDLEMVNEGEVAVVVWTMKGNQILPV